LPQRIDCIYIKYLYFAAKKLFVMTEIVFEKIANGYEAIFEVNKDFSLHIESNSDIRVVLYHKSASDGEYEAVSVLSGSHTVDRDYSASVYPKTIRIFSQKQLTRCTIAYASGSTPSEDVEELRALIQEQIEINNAQQEQIDENARVNEEQETKIIDNTTLANASQVEGLFE